MPAVDGEIGTLDTSGVRHAIAAIAQKKIGDLTSATTFKGDLAFDSLMAMELSVALEAQTGRAVDTTRLARCETVGDVERLMNETTRTDLVRASAIEKKPEEPIRIFPENEINVVVVGGEANGYWRIMGAKYRKTVSIDAWL